MRGLLTAAVLGQTGTKALTVAAAAVGAGLEARLAGTLVASCVVDAELGAAGRAGLALVHLCKDGAARSAPRHGLGCTHRAHQGCPRHAACG